MLINYALSLVSKSPLPDTKATEPTVQIILNIVFVIVGALAFLMLVIAGFRYVIYGSDPAKVAEARKQILYALIGLVLVAMAATIVNFILNRIS